MCQHICNFFSRPFSFCVLFTLLLSVAPLIACVIIFATKWDNTCDKPLHIWLLVAAITFFFNTLFGFYVLFTLSLKEMDRSKSIFQNMLQFVMYDWVVCIYIIFAAFMFAWSIVGRIWLVAEAKDGGCRDSEDVLFRMTDAAVSIMWAFLGGGLLILFLSLCFSVDCCEDCVPPTLRAVRISENRQKNDAPPPQTFQYNSAPHAGPVNGGSPAYAPAAVYAPQLAYNQNAYAAAGPPPYQQDHYVAVNAPPNQQQQREDPSLILKSAAVVGAVAGGAAAVASVGARMLKNFVHNKK